MTPRYAKRLGSVSVGSATVDSWIVIRTDEVAPHDVIAKGFQRIPDQLSDDQVVEKYGVSEIITVTNEKLRVT